MKQFRPIFAPHRCVLTWAAISVWVSLLWAVPPSYAAPEAEPRRQSDLGGAKSAGASSEASGEHELKSPVLRESVEAQYPPEALASGLEGAVVLKLEIDTEGRVTAASVTEPAGHGFDEAALEAVRHFLFEPATRGGAPVRARILYRYRFTLTPPAPLTTPAPTPAEPPQPAGTAARGIAPVGPGAPTTMPAPQSPARSNTGLLRGTLVAGNPSQPVAGAQVRIRAESRELVEVASADNGEFATGPLPPGKYSVEITSPGFERIDSLEDVTEGIVSSIRYQLVPIASPLEVLVRGAPMQREVSRYAMTRRELARVPGTFGDAILSMQALPSVARPQAFSGQLVVRGAMPSETQVFIDGTYVPRVFHGGALSSVVPTEMIERLELYPSNFSARFGRGMGAVVDVALRKTNSDGKYHGSAQVDFVNARANAEGPVPGLSGWNFMAGMRASYVHTWLVPVLRDNRSSLNAIPRYYDYQAYFEKEFGNGGYCRVGFFGATDQFSAIQKNEVDTDYPLDSFGNIQALLRLPIAKGLRWDSTLSAGFMHQRESSFNDAQNTTDAKLVVGRSELTWSPSQLGKLRIGSDIQYAPFDLHLTTRQREQGGKVAYGPVLDANLRVLDLHGSHFRPAFFTEIEATPADRVQSVFGVRADYAHDTGQWDIAPRWTGRVDLVRGPRKTAIKGGLGVFFQPPAPGETIPEIGTAGIRSQRAIHGTLGFEQGITDQLELSVEGFAKHLKDLLVRRMNDAGVPTLVNSGSGYVVGVDLLLRYRPDSRFFGWVAYTLSRSMRKGAWDRPLLLSGFDQPHIVNAVGSYRLGRGWEVGGRFRFISGFVHDACYGGMFDNAHGSYYCYGPPERERLAPFHQLDIRVEKAWKFANWSLSFYADVMNVYYHNSPDSVVANYDYSRLRTRSLSLPFLPSLGIRGEF